MIEFLSDTPAHLVAVRISGRIEAEDIQRFTERLDEALDANEEVSFFMEIESLKSMSPQAVLKDVQVGLSQIKNLRRIHRVAVVADQEWIRTGAEWESRLFSSLDLRAFEPHERAEALAWARATPPRAGKGLERGLEEIPTADPGTLAFAVVGPVTGADIEYLTPKLSAAYDQHGSANLLMRMDDGYRFRLDIFSKKLAEMKTDALRHIDRYAVVGAPEWIASAAELVAPLLKLDLHFFERDDEAAAWEWLGTRPREAPGTERLDGPTAA